MVLKNKEPLLVVGGNGTLGRAVTVTLNSRGKKTIGTTQKTQSISNELMLLDLLQDGEDWSCQLQPLEVYWCAGVSSIAACCENPTKTRRINVDNALGIISRFLGEGAHVIYPSTNAVFDGTHAFVKSEERPCPLTNYGKQKAEAEKRILAINASFTIVRFSKIVNVQYSLFKEWAQRLQLEKPIHPFFDSVFSPISDQFAATVLVEAAARRLPGILQVSGKSDISYFDAAVHLTKQLGADLSLVKPVSIKNNTNFLGTIPSHTTLDSSRLIREFGLASPAPTDVIDEWIQRDKIK